MAIRINLNNQETSLLLKGLDFILKRVALARVGTYHFRIPALETGKDLFASRLYDGAMQHHLVSTYGKLRTIPPSRKLRMNAFDLASCALSLRVVQSQDLENRKEIDLELASELKSKIENHRKKAAYPCFAKRTGNEWRSLALQVVVDSVDQKQVFYWADLARRELRRLRHGVSLLTLLKNEERRSVSWPALS